MCQCLCVLECCVVGIVLSTDALSCCCPCRNVLSPGMRAGLTPSKALIDKKQVVQVACTEQLYKIFERC